MAGLFRRAQWKISSAPLARIREADYQVIGLRGRGVECLYCVGKFVDENFSGNFCFFRGFKFAR